MTESMADRTTLDQPQRARGRPRGWQDKTAQNTIKSLDRAMEVFEYLSQRPGLTLSELAAEVGQSNATLYRILVTLEARGFVAFETATQTWHVGARAFVVGARYIRRSGLVEQARPILRDLMEETGETANLGIEQNGQVLFVSQVETPASIRAFFPPGTLARPHASGIGKALLAEMDPRRLRRVMAAEPMERFTDHTLTGEDQLLADLQATRARGYAIDAEERNIGMRCIASPVFDMHNEAVAGISVSGPTSRMTVDRTPQISEAVVQAAARLTMALGGEPS